MRTAILLALCAGAHAVTGQELSIVAQSNAVQITWPAPAPGFVLQHTPSLESTAWTDSDAPALVNGFNVVSIPTTNASGFFRLARSLAGCSTNSADEPDMEFRDTDCDGIDGTATNAIFVATTGVDEPGRGLDYRQPVRTINYAMARAAAHARASLYLQAGTYFENVDLPPGIALYGGFDANWNRGLYNNASHRTVIQGAYHDAARQWITLRLTGGSTAPNVLQNLIVIGSDATLPGYSSMAVHALNASLDLDTVGVYCGDGADGTNGAAGLDAMSLAPPATAANGGGADEFSASCETSSHGGGGSAGVNVIVNSPSTRPTHGGGGGAGGEMDTSCGPFGPCSNCTATRGDRGGNAGYTLGSFGMGGAGGAGGSACDPGLNGTNGVVANGIGGTGGSGIGVVAGTYPAPVPGTSGSTGENGSGGGGGGGSGGCDLGIDSYGAGGGGGGAGGLAARGGGSPGGGAGGSFGIFAVNSQVTLRNCEIIRGDGGTGGSGGIGGQGQPGGLGGRGGGASGDSAAGGNGGNGAHGGHGGGGGGGAGGFSVGVALRSGSGYSDLGNNRVVGGNPGAGGQGGLSAPNAPAGDRDGNPGQPGAPGSLLPFANL